MRLFIAAELPENVLEALAETSALLRGNVRGRYVAPDSFHVTLAFLGDVASERVSALADALDASCRGFDAFPVSLGPLGSFGRRNSATLWQGFDDPGDLPQLADAVRSGLRSCGFTFDDKKFLPHVTLMRKADLTRGTLPMPSVANGMLETVSLFSSDLSGARPVYEPLCTCELPNGNWRP